MNDKNFYEEASKDVETQQHIVTGLKKILDSFKKPESKDEEESKQVTKEGKEKRKRFLK